MNLFLRLWVRRVVFLALVALAALAVGCNESPASLTRIQSGTLVGESTHFRLFVDPAFDTSTLSDYVQGQAGLDALEGDWADKQTMLKMPDDAPKIDYHLMTPQQAFTTCQERGDSCEWALQIATSVLPFQHELIHAYMELVAPGAEPVSFIAEGTAQAIGCYGPEGVYVGVALAEDVPSWQEAIVSDELAYGQGGLFVRYLIRTQGIDAFVRYYRQAPARHDPALFAANFAAFWHMSIDDAWAAMHVVGPGAAPIDSPICPCSLPMPSTDGQPLSDDIARQYYWPLPDTAGPTLALTGPGGHVFSFSDCEGVAPSFESESSDMQPLPVDVTSQPDVAIALVQLPSDGRRRYTGAPITSASVGPYIADSCAGGVPYQLPADFVSRAGQLSILVDQGSMGGVSKYVQVQIFENGEARLADGIDVYSSCPFDNGGGVNNTTGGPVIVGVLPSQMNVRWRVPAVLPGGVFPDPAGASIQFFTEPP